MTAFHKKFLIGITIVLATFAITPGFAHATVPSWDEGGFGMIPPTIYSLSAPVGAQHSKEQSILTLDYNTILSAIVPSWDELIKILAHAAIDTVKQQTFAWIKSGFNGKPHFLQDPEKFFKDIGDQASSIYIQDVSEKLNLVDPATGKPIICQPNFGIQFVLDLEFGQPDYFKYRSKCTISQVVDNIDNFYDDFSNGNWQAFARIQKSNNNPLGFYTMSLAEEQRRREQSSSVFRNSAQYGGGYLPSITCAQNENTALGCRKFSIHTPAKAIGDRVAQTLGVDYNEFISANEVSDLIATLINLGIDKVVNDFLQ